jgi:hypothetical protein
MNIFDLSEFDFGIPVVEEEVKPKKPKCVCGSWAIGVEPYMTGHDEDCEVHEDKTPITEIK